MTRRSRRTPPAGNDGEKNDGTEALDQKLKQLGAQFLDEDVPDALLEVLRRGLRPGAAGKAEDPDGAADPDHPPTSKKEP